MKKTIITVFAFLVIFGFAVSGAMAQTWTWADPVSFSHTGTGKLTELAVDPTNDLLMYGIDDETGGAVIVTLGHYSNRCTDSSWTRHRPVRDLSSGLSGGCLCYHRYCCGDMGHFNVYSTPDPTQGPSG